MPDRIVRAAILTSDRVNVLSFAEEVFYRRLISVVDDFGRFDGRNSVLRAQLFPLRLDSVTERDVGKWKLATAEAGLVTVYAVDGREYLEVLNFGQRLRAEKSKWPDPPPSSADNRGHLTAAADSRGHPPPYSYSYSDAYSETKSKKTVTAVRSVFVAPTVDEVRTYCLERKNSVDPHAFVDFYESKGWKVGKVAMKDWRASVRTWERNRDGSGTNGTGGGTRGGGSNARLRGTGLIEQLEAEQEAARVAGDAARSDG